ncbi:MAG TPA: hypothetical protein VJ867_11945 [Gemmatimonadaceae bacterium]|nr:hypothetical protein [Gemmatimonadaceae bacterium]
MKAITVTVVLATLAACAASEITSVDATSQAQQAHLFTSAQPNLLECPTSSTVTATGVVTPLDGGLIALGGTRVMVPAGAVAEATTITLTIPASRFMEIDVSVAGVDHFLFQLPITVAVDYSRCNRSNIFRSSLTAWYIDSQTKAPLEQMPSVDNKLTQTVIFTTGHLSGYALAN